MTADNDKKQQSHKKKMAKLKDNIDATIAAANTERGVGILLTGNGKGNIDSAKRHGKERRCGRHECQQPN